MKGYTLKSHCVLRLHLFERLTMNSQSLRESSLRFSSAVLKKFLLLVDGAGCKKREARKRSECIKKLNSYVYLSFLEVSLRLLKRKAKRR